MSPKDDDITWAIVLQHMQGMEQRLVERIDGVEIKVDRLAVKVDQNHAILSTQIANMDARLDDLEVVQVPKLKKAVGMR